MSRRLSYYHSPLFPPERRNGIDPKGATGGQVACQQGGGSEDADCAGEGERIIWRNSVQQGSDRTGKSERPRTPDQDSDEDEP